jgi:Condensation domain
MKLRGTDIDRDNITTRIANLPPEKRALLERKLKEKSLDSLLKGVIPRRPQQDPAFLSFSQQRLWFLDQYDPGSAVYNIPKAVRTTGVLDLAALEQSLREIVRRHEVLRTTFSMSGEKPIQVITPSTNYSLPVVDLGDLPGNEREGEARRLATEVRSFVRHYSGLVKKITSCC